MKQPTPASRTDFLQHLIERSSVMQAALEPRVPSIFEPASAQVGVAGLTALDEQVVTDESVEGPAARTRSAPMTSDASRSQADRSSANMKQSDLHVAATRALQQPIRATSNAGVMPSMVAVQPLVRVIEERVAPTPAAAVVSRPPLRLEDHEPTLRPDPVLPRLQSDPAAVYRQQIGEARAAPPALLKAATLERVVAESPAAARSIAGVRDIEDVDAPHAPPPVHVTIGRLEIRALQSAAAPRPARSSRTQSMSLDDYLQQRGGSR